MKPRILRSDGVLQKLLPHMCVAEWGRADTDIILRDSVLCKEKGLAAISLLPDAISAARSAADDIKVYCFIDDIAKIPAISERKNTSVQLFFKDNRMENLPELPDIEIIPAFALKNIEHLDWTRIVLLERKLGGRGFMFIDEAGEYIHRFYDFLNIIGDSFSGAIHYCGASNDLNKLDDAYRLVEKIRPDLLSNLCLFVSGEFFRNLDFRYKSL
ncbi:MAG: hypothetical protein LBQ49_00700 [Rickettsiales bacterium]|jgi:hypothetical protein|nr:hypothetical protein [Rickettsiales bacterium]